MVPEWLSFIDASVLMLVVLFAWGGLQKGFASQIAHVISFAGMGIFLYWGYPAIFRYFQDVSERVNESYLVWLLLAGLVLLGFFIFMMTTRLLMNLFKAKFSERTDKGLGFLFGFFRGGLFALIALIILILVDTTGTAKERVGERSRVGGFVSNRLIPRIQPHFTKANVELRLQQMRGRLRPHDADLDSATN